MTDTSYVTAIRERVVVFDGASGTWLQGQDLGPDDFGSEALEGHNEILCDTRPELITQMHREYLESGADVIETNSFGAFGVPLAEYDMAERALSCR
ncbi:MAG: homocysteine S-methyltransferase family protein [Microthrixaceae bacterium]